MGTQSYGICNTCKTIKNLGYHSYRNNTFSDKFKELHEGHKVDIFICDSCYKWDYDKKTKTLQIDYDGGWSSPPEEPTRFIGYEMDYEELI